MTTPINMISAAAAATLRLTLETRRCWIEKTYPAGSQEHMRHTHNLAHLERELGLVEQPAPWEVVDTYCPKDGPTVQLTRNGREWRMRGNGDHDLHDSSEERAMAHWKGYRSR